MVAPRRSVLALQKMSGAECFNVVSMSSQCLATNVDYWLQSTLARYDMKDQFLEESFSVSLHPNQIYRKVVDVFLGKAAWCLLVLYLLQTRIIKQTGVFVLSSSGGRVGSDGVMMRKRHDAGQKSSSRPYPEITRPQHVSDGVAC